VPFLAQTLRPKVGGTRFYEYQPNGAWTIATHTVATAAQMRDGSNATYEATVVGFDSAHYTYNYNLGRAADTDDFIGFDMDPFTADAHAGIAFVRFLATVRWDGNGGFVNAGCFLWPAMDVAGAGTYTGLGGSWDGIRSGWGVLNGQLVANETPGAIALVDYTPLRMTTDYAVVQLDMPYQPATAADGPYDPNLSPLIAWDSASLNNRTMGIHIGPLGIGQASNTCLCSEFYYEVWGADPLVRRRGGVVAGTSRP
jgi:hypothetical protein